MRPGVFNNSLFYKMITTIFQIVFLVMLYLCYRELKTIAQDTRKKEEISDALDKLALLMGEKEKKIVKFAAKE